MTLSCALIGAGHFGKHYARLLREVEGAELALVFDRAPAPDVFGDVRRAQSFDEVLSDSTVDAVIIATPAPTHAAFIEAALKAGKHVLVEKPMTTNLPDALPLERVAQESGKVFMVGHQYLYNDYIRHLKEILESGVLGRVRLFTAFNLYLGPIRKGIGCFWETATHEIAILDYLFGPQAIKESIGQSVYMKEGSEFEDAATALVRFRGGLSASISVSWFSPEKVRKFIICGEKGMALFDDLEEKDKLRLYRYPYPSDAAFAGSTSSFMHTSSHDIITPEVRAREPLKNQLEHFIDCIKRGKKPLTDIAHGIRVTKHLTEIVGTFRK